MVFGGASKRHCINSRKMPCQNTIGTGTARTIWNVLTVIALVWETGLWKCFVEVLIGTTSRLIDSNATNTSRKPLDPTEWIFDGHMTYLMPQLWKPNICFFHTQDIIVIPMEFFDLPKTVLLSVLTWLTVLFWSVDMLPLSWSNLTAGCVVRVTNAIFCRQNAKHC